MFFKFIENKKHGNECEIRKRRKKEKIRRQLGPYLPGRHCEQSRPENPGLQLQYPVLCSQTDEKLPGV